MLYIYWFVHTIGFYMSASMYAPGHHRPNMLKTQPLNLDPGLGISRTNADSQ